MAKIKVFQKAKSQGKGHKVKQYGTKKERSSPSIQTLWPRFKVLAGKQTDQTLYVPKSLITEP